MDIKNKEALIAEIEQFKEEALKMHIVQVLADTYERSSLFDHNINADGSVIWFRTQARQLWDFWQAAKAQAVPEWLRKSQEKVKVYELHVETLKQIHENEFNEKSESSYILGNLDGFFECLESDLGGIK